MFSDILCAQAEKINGRNQDEASQGDKFCDTKEVLLLDSFQGDLTGIPSVIVNTAEMQMAW